MRAKFTKPAEQPIKAPPGKTSWRRLPATGRYDARSVADALTAGEGPPNKRMRLKALELMEWGKGRVLVIEMDNKSDRNQSVAVMIGKRATARAF